MNIPNKLLQLRKIVSGPPENFPLTVRIFHSLLVVSMAALLYNIPLNAFVGLPWIALASFVSFGIVSLLYYISRYRHQTTLARLIYCLVGLTLFVINYFLNSGIDGPTGYFFMLMMVVIVAIAPVKEYWYWVTGNIMAVIGLHFLQYVYPQTVPYTYPRLIDRYLDVTSAYVTVIMVILACFYAIRKHYEAERREAQQNAAKLRDLDAEKNKLFSIIAHDLRSPLNHIQGYLEILSEYDLTEDERRDIKDQLLNSTRGTLDMVNNILNWSMNQMNGVSIQRELLQVCALLESQLTLPANIAERKQIALTVDIAPDAVIFGNGDMIQLIVRNLVNNAIKFTSPGGSIKVVARQKGDNCLITIIDSGNGKPAQLSDKVFRLSGSSSVGTANEKGVGLGLVLCHDYTLALGGKLWFDCHEVTGTTFYLELPGKPAVA